MVNYTQKFDSNHKPKGENIMKVESYKLFLNKHYVRIATKVTTDDGQEIKFMEKLGKRQAIKEAEKFLDRQAKGW